MDNYFIENKETGKIELHFEKSAYMALNEDQKKEIKSNFLFSRYSSAWVSRCKFPNLSHALRIAENLGLENAGKTGEKLSFEEQMEVKAARAENRANRFEYKAEQAEKKAEQLQAPINSMHGDIAFFTQPNINTSAGRAFTRKRDRMWASFEQGMEEFRKSEYYQNRAKTARESTKTPSIDFCQRRIDEAQASIRKLNKNIEEYNNYLDQIEQGKEVTNKYGWKVDISIDSINSNIERWEEMLEDAVSKVAYYDSLIQSQGGIHFSKDNIKPGYIVKLRSSWKGAVLVVSTGPKNIKYKDIDGSGFELSANYSEIEKILKVQEVTEPQHPFTVGEKFTIEEWNGHEYVNKEYSITKITHEKVTVKSGTDRAKSLRPRKSYDGKYYILSIADGRNGYYTKAI